MKNTLRTLVLAAALAGSLSTAAAAQPDAPPRSNTSGVSLGIFLNGSALKGEGADEVESGAGLGLHLGYGFHRNASVFARANVAAMEPPGGGEGYALAHADLGLRYSFGGPRSAVRPFVQGAVGGRSLAVDLGSEGTLEARGLGFTAGGGLEYFFSRSLALEAGLSLSIGEFSEGRIGNNRWADLDESVSATTSRFDIGLSWHP